MAQAIGKGKSCFYSLEVNHTSDECALSNKPRHERQLRLLDIGLSPYVGQAEPRNESRAGGCPKSEEVK